MNCPLAAARRRSMAGLISSSINSVCSIITTASAPRGMTPPVAIAVAVPGLTSTDGAVPQAITSALSVNRRGALPLARMVSTARTAKPSTLERSNGGASTGAIMSAASTRPRIAASGSDSGPSTERSMPISKRRCASSGVTTSRNCSCRAARRTASRIVVASRACSGSMAMVSRQLARLRENLRCRRRRR